MLEACLLSACAICTFGDNLKIALRESRHEWVLNRVPTFGGAGSLPAICLRHLYFRRQFENCSSRRNIVYTKLVQVVLGASCKHEWVLNCVPTFGGAGSLPAIRLRDLHFRRPEFRVLRDVQDEVRVEGQLEQDVLFVHIRPVVHRQRDGVARRHAELATSCNGKIESVKHAKLSISVHRILFLISCHVSMSIGNGPKYVYENII